MHSRHQCVQQQQHATMRDLQGRIEGARLIMQVRARTICCLVRITVASISNRFFDQPPSAQKAMKSGGGGGDESFAPTKFRRFLQFFAPDYVQVPVYIYGESN